MAWIASFWVPPFILHFVFIFGLKVLLLDVEQNQLQRPDHKAVIECQLLREVLNTFADFIEKYLFL